MLRRLATLVLTLVFCISFIAFNAAANSQINPVRPIIIYTVSNQISKSAGIIENAYFYEGEEIRSDSSGDTFVNRYIATFQGDRLDYFQLAETYTYRVAGSTTITYRENLPLSSPLRELVFCDEAFSHNVVLDVDG